MPHTLFTRFLAVVLWLALIFPMLWPTNLLWAKIILPTLPLVTLIFMWSCARAVPIYDDHAFHRTLPRDGAWAFRHMLTLPLLVLLGGAIFIATYCVYFNLTWRTWVSFAVNSLAPALTMIAAFGVAASAGSGRGGAKIWPWVAVLLPVLFSCILISRSVPPLNDALKWYSPTRGIPAICLIYGAAWWIIVVWQKRVTGLVLAAISGFILPWVVQHDTEAARRIYNAFPEENFPVALIRKTVTGGDTLPTVDETLEVHGLLPGQVLTSWTIGIGWFTPPWYPDGDRDAWRTISFTTKNGDERPGIRYALLAAQPEPGKTLWGRAALHAAVRPHLPAGLKIREWAVSEVPYEMLTMEVQSRTETTVRETGSLPEDVKLMPWLSMTSVLESGEPTILEASKGGTIRIPEGGMMQVSAMTQDGPKARIRIKLRTPVSWRDGDPWFHLFPNKQARDLPPWVVIVDGVTETAYFTDCLMDDGDAVGLDFRKLEVDPTNKYSSSPDITPEILGRSKLYFFWPKYAAGPRMMSLEPPAPETKPDQK